MGYDRMYYTIGQVSKISALPQSVLRYWETVFDSLNPPKSDGGTRQYTEVDVEVILEIKKYLYDEGYTIKGANKLIQEKYSKPNLQVKSDSSKNVAQAESTKVYTNSTETQAIQFIKKRIHTILDMLED